jgi:hypothetical protein
MIEAAILLPMFLMIIFGVMEFGNMYMARYQARDVASSVGDYLQANPSASSGDLQTFVTNLGFGTLKNTGPDQENNVFTKIKIKSEKTMLTAAQFDALCSGGGVKNWANPWLGGDPADDKNDYYIHICYPYTYNTITPLSDLTVGAVPETKTMNSKALAYITKAISCPDGQVLQSTTSGSATCVARDNNYSCPDGQFLRGITNGVPSCFTPAAPNYIIVGGGIVKMPNMKGGGNLGNVHCSDVYFQPGLDASRLNPIGNVYYKGGKDWGHWTVLFEALDAPNGKIRACIDSGDAWRGNIYSEYLSWTMFYRNQ